MVSLNASVRITSDSRICSLLIADASRKEPSWNFWKYLIDVDGKVVDAWGPDVSVKDIRPQISDMVRKLIIKRKVEL